MLSEHAALRKDKSTRATLQHRHFAEIARIIATMVDAGYRADIAILFADELANSNPRFDRGRFMRACEVNETY